MYLKKKVTAVQFSSSIPVSPRDEISFSYVTITPHYSLIRNTVKKQEVTCPVQDAKLGNTCQKTRKFSIRNRNIPLHERHISAIQKECSSYVANVLMCVNF